MIQPSEWARGILRTTKQTELTEGIRAELRLRDERMFQSKAPGSWQAIVDKLRADCGLLGDLCQMSDIPMGQTMGNSGVLLQGNGTTIRMVSAQFDLNGHLIQVVRSHVRDGVSVFDSKEFIKLKLQNDEIVFLVEDLKFHTIEQVSNRIMASLIEPIIFSLPG